MKTVQSIKMYQTICLDQCLAQYILYIFEKTWLIIISQLLINKQSWAWELTAINCVVETRQVSPLRNYCWAKWQKDKFDIVCWRCRTGYRF